MNLEIVVEGLEVAADVACIQYLSTAKIVHIAHRDAAVEVVLPPLQEVHQLGLLPLVSQFELPVIRSCLVRAYCPGLQTQKQKTRQQNEL